MLYDRRQLTVRPDEVRELVQDYHDGPIGPEAEHCVDRRGPRRQPDRPGSPDVVPESLAEAPKRVGVGGLGGTEVETAGRSCQLVQQQRLALAAAPRDDPEGGSGALVRGEPGEVGPLGVPVEDVLGLDGEREILRM